MELEEAVGNGARIDSRTIISSIEEREDTNESFPHDEDLLAVGDVAEDSFVLFVFGVGEEERGEVVDVGVGP